MSKYLALILLIPFSIGFKLASFNNKVASKNRHLSINMNFDYAQNEKWKDFISQGIAAGNKYSTKLSYISITIREI
jgi:hypothetical protein